MPNIKNRFNYFLISGLLFILIFSSLFWLVRQDTSAEPLNESSSILPPSFDLQITKSVTPTYGPPGSDVTYIISIKNNGPDAAINLIISDTLPTAVILSHVDTGGDFFTQTITPTLSWYYPSLIPGEQDSITITGIISAALVNGPVLTNTAVITQSSNRPLPALMAGADCPGGNDINIIGANTTIVGNIHSNGDINFGGSNPTIIGLITSVGSISLPPGTTISPTTNNPSQVPPRNYPISYTYEDFLAPDGYIYQAITAINPSHYHFYNGQITLAVLQSQGWISGNVIDEGVYVTPSGFSFPGTGDGLIAPAMTFVSQGKIAIDGNAMQLQPYWNGLLYFTEYDGNPCSSAPSIDISGNDTNIGGLFYVPTGMARIASSDNINLIGSIIAGIINVSGSNISFTADQQYKPVDSNPANNTAETPFYVTPATTFDLEITKSVTPTIGLPGTAITYTITISNNGPEVATDLLITDTLPAELIMPHVDTGGIFVTQTITPTLSWAYPSLSAGEQASLTITGIISPSIINGTTITNIASINQTPNVVLPTLMAGAFCPGANDIAISGSNVTILGNIHSNEDISVIGSSQVITGFVTYGGSTNLPNPGVTLTPTINNPAQVPPRDYPIDLLYSDFVSPGWAYQAIIATNPDHYHYYSGEIDTTVLASQGWLDGSLLDTGVYVTPVGFNLTNTSGLVATNSTFITLGDIDFNDDQIYLRPYFSDLLFFTEATGDPCSSNPAIDVASNSGNFGGIWFAPLGKISVASTSATSFFSSLIGGTVSLSGSNLYLEGDIPQTTVDSNPLNNTAETPFTLILPIPTADPGGPYVVNEGSAVQLDASASTGINLSAYDWDLDNDGLYDDATGVNVTFTNTADDAIHPIGIRVSNSYGFTDTAVTTVTVTNVAPNLTNLSLTHVITESESVTLTGTIIEPGILDTLTLTVDWADGTQDILFYPANTAAFSLTHPYLDDPPGPSETYTVSLNIEDKDGGSSTADLTTQVLNSPPIVNAGPDQETFVNNAITVNGTFTDLGPLDTHTITWDFGDGTTLTGSLTATHTYQNAGSYLVTLTVIDDDGGLGTDTLLVLVSEYTIFMPAVIQQSSTTTNAPSNSADSTTPAIQSPQITIHKILPVKAIIKPD